MEPAGTSTTSPHATCSPGDPLGNRSVRDGLAELFRSQPSVEPESNAAAGFCGEDIPRLGLAARFAHRPGEGVSRMHLDRQRLEREKQFQEQGGLVGRGVRPFVPDLANLAVCSAGLAPWLDIRAAPGLFDGSHKGKFYRHGPLLVRVGRRGSTHRRALAKVQTRGAAHKCSARPEGRSTDKLLPISTSANGLIANWTSRAAASGSSPVHNNRCTSAI